MTQPLPAARNKCRLVEYLQSIPSKIAAYFTACALESAMSFPGAPEMKLFSTMDELYMSEASVFCLSSSSEAYYRSEMMERQGSRVRGRREKGMPTTPPLTVLNPPPKRRHSRRYLICMHMKRPSLPTIHEAPEEDAEDLDGELSSLGCVLPSLGTLV